MKLFRPILEIKMRGIPELVLSEIKLNKIQYNSLYTNLNKIATMVWPHREFQWRMKDLKTTTIELLFKWKENVIIFEVCPWKILSKRIVKWK